MPCNDSAVEVAQRQAEVWHLACGCPKWIQISGYSLCQGTCRKQVGIQRRKATTHFPDNCSQLSASWWPLRQRGELYYSWLIWSNTGFNLCCKSWWAHPASTRSEKTWGENSALPTDSEVTWRCCLSLPHAMKFSFHLLHFFPLGHLL